MSLAEPKIFYLPRESPELEDAAKKRDFTQRLLVVREGTCQERWGSWGTRERLQDRPKI